MTTRPRLWKWTLTTVLGLAIGLPLGALAGVPLEALVGMVLVTPLMLGVSGLVLGGSQLLALRGFLRRPLAWLLLSALGLSLGLTAGLVTVEEGGRLLTGSPVRMSSTGPAGLALSLVVIGIVSGLGLGAFQSLALRREQLAVSGWIVANVVGLTAGFVVGFAFAELVLGGVNAPLGLVAVLVCAGLGLALATASRLLRVEHSTA